MSTTKQSKHLFQLEYEPWFKKNNYPSKWLSDESKEIIKKIIQNDK